jgi:hypothetical protein
MSLVKVVVCSKLRSETSGYQTPGDKMPNIRKANKRDKARHKGQHGMRVTGRSWEHTINRKRKEDKRRRGGK